MVRRVRWVGGSGLRRRLLGGETVVTGVAGGRGSRLFRGCIARCLGQRIRKISSLKGFRLYILGCEYMRFFETLGRGALFVNVACASEQMVGNERDTFRW